MMDESLKKYYDILELECDASGEDINRAYQHLKKLYSKTTLATAPIDNEWNEDDKREILAQVEEAYTKLWPNAREEKVDIPEGPTLTPLEENPAQENEEKPISTLSSQDEYRAPEEPAVSIDLPAPQPSQEMQPSQVIPPPQNKAELFDSYVEEEVLFDLGTESEIGTEIEIELDTKELDTKINEVEPAKEETLKEEAKEEVKNEEAPKEISQEVIEEEVPKKVSKEVAKEDTLAEQFIGEIKTQPITGAVLKKIRENLELDLREMKKTTQIPKETLEAIESEDFAKLPEAGFLRYYVTNYIKALGIPDPKDATDQYMKHFREWKSKLESE